MNKLKEFRERRGLRIVDLASISNCSVSTIWLAENGFDRLRKKTKVRLSEALEIDLKEIFPGQ